MLAVTDRISAFDVVLPDSRSLGKGQVLSGTTLHWFGLTGDIVANHLVTADLNVPVAVGHAELAGRAMLVSGRQRGTDRVRGPRPHHRQRAGRSTARAEVCGIGLPRGLEESAPARADLHARTKATGHDENISFDDGARSSAKGLAERLNELTSAICTRPRPTRGSGGSCSRTRSSSSGRPTRS